jgi:NADH dehydrogenase (ubiquinone) Fe-S protein 6
MSASRLRAIQPFSRQLASSRRTFAVSARQLEAKASHPNPGPETKAPAVTTDEAPQVTPGAVQKEVLQAPNRSGVWSRNQRPRSEAMTGPRFEQTDFDLQVR